MTKESAIEKVKKLLNMTTANGASEGEMLSALANAQRIMARFGLSEEEIKVDTEKDEVGETSYTFGTKSVSSYQALLAMNLAKHFGVEILLTTKRDHSQVLKVIGEQSKTEIFTETLTFTYNCFKTFWSKYHKSLPQDCNKNTARGDYFEGFCKGINSALTENENKYALVVTSSALTKDYMSKYHAMCSTRKCSVTSENNPVHRMAGYVDGKSSVESKGKVICG